MLAVVQTQNMFFMHSSKYHEVINHELIKFFLEIWLTNTSLITHLCLNSQDNSSKFHLTLKTHFAFNSGTLSKFRIFWEHNNISMLHKKYTKSLLITFFMQSASHPNRRKPCSQQLKGYRLPLRYTTMHQFSLLLGDKLPTQG